MARLGRKWLLLLLLPTLFPFALSFTPPILVKDYGIYSDLRPGPMGVGGPDYFGTELFITWNGYVFIQYADGKLHQPAVIKAKRTPSLEFDVPREVGPLGHFKGGIDGDHVWGKFEGNGMKIDLPKKQSIWQW